MLEVDVVSDETVLPAVTVESEGVDRTHQVEPAAERPFGRPGTAAGDVAADNLGGVEEEMQLDVPRLAVNE